MKSFKEFRAEQEAKNPSPKKSLIMDLTKRGEKLLASHLGKNEKIIVKLKGSFGEAFVVTEKRIYLLKWGYMSKNLIGGRCMAFEFQNVTGIELKKNLLTGTLEVLSASLQNTQRSYWNNAYESDNIVTFQRDYFDIFTEATRVARETIAGSQSSAKPSNDYDELEKLADLLAKKIITKKEFELKKKAILNI